MDSKVYINIYEVAVFSSMTSQLRFPINIIVFQETHNNDEYIDYPLYIKKRYGV